MHKAYVEYPEPVKSGALFAGLWKQNGGAEMKDIQRQKLQWQKEASVAFSELDVETGLKAYEDNNCVFIYDTPLEAMQAQVNDWSKRKDNLQENVMLAGTRKEVSKLNIIARDTLKQQNKLGEEITASTDYGKQSFAVNDRILFKKNNNSLFDVKNGELGTIKRVGYNKQGDPFLQIEKDGGSTVNLNLADYGNITHGYALTTHASQGISVDKTSPLIGSFNGQEMSYVQFTRHKKECKIYSDKQTIGKGKLSDLLNKSMQKDNISDLSTVDFEKSLNSSQSLLDKIKNFSMNHSNTKQRSRDKEIELTR